MKTRWRSGNRVQLLTDGDEFFPRLFAAIGKARQEVLLETFILNDDKVGRELHSHLIAAAARGVRVAITVDGYGSPGLEGEFLDKLVSSGVTFQVFNPGLTLLGVRTNLFRRMHRKIAVVDGMLAYVGGINFIADQLSDFGEEAKRDFSAEIEGPVVDDIRTFFIKNNHRHHLHSPHQPATENNTPQPGKAKVLFVDRDNRRARNNIERQYHLAIRNAKHDLTIANAYFFPGYKLLWRLRKAAQRGVRVSLVLQGCPDIGIARLASRQLYRYLLSGGVNIYEYNERPLHGKVAIADDDWSTIGSSNLDPLSLSLNLEANVVIIDRGFNQALRDRLQNMIQEHSRCMNIEEGLHNHWWSGLASTAAFHVLRHFPRWAGLLPAHTITLKKIVDNGTAATLPEDAHNAASADS